MNKQEARQQIQRLIKKYEGLSPAERKKHNESMTCRVFILPLFQALGWDVYNNLNNEVTSEDQISGKRVDYAFHLDGVIKFFLEAKKIEVDLREERWAEQAVFYAWHKSVPWAVLTDFESIKVFNAEWDEPNIEQSLLFEISYKEYLTDKRLWLLSKEAMAKGELDRYAEENFKKPKREPVDKQLAEDLLRWRTLLFKDLKGWNSDKNLTDKQFNDSVQKLLDRLIFIRTTEDRKIEDEKLREIARNWQENKLKINLADELKKLFKKYNDNYDSKLFQPHACDALEYEDNLLADIIGELYKNRKGIRYDFSSINADVLGSIYEQYLGQIQQEASDKKSSKRKSQGIYYTPRYIVDYIVKNTLGEALRGKSGHQASQLRILDPACGSGSFLIKAFEVLDEHIRRENNQANTDRMKNYARKVGILTSNIYGVDLDEEAVEIAQLNLLLKALEFRELLPNLSHNIECGNSLISGDEAELKKYFGENWKDKKPFNWEERFKSVMDKGGFDVIIGNPPYIRNRELNPTEKKFFDDNFYSASGQYDIYQLFFERSIKLLKEGGYLGFITSNRYAIADYGKKLREFILENCKIVSIVDVSSLEVFKEAATYPYIIILQKTGDNETHVINAYRVEAEDKLEANKTSIKQVSIKATANKNFTVKNEPDFISALEEKSEKLGDIASIKETIHTGNVRKKLIVNEKIDKTCKKLLAGKDCHRYWFKWSGKYIRYDKNLIDRGKKEYANLIDSKYFDASKILLREIASNIECCLDNEKYYTLNKVYSVQTREQKYSLNYLLALLNSKLLSYYFRNKFEEAHVRGGYLQFKKIYTSQIPIYKIDFSNKKEKAKHDELASLADKMLKFNKGLQKIDPIMDEKEYGELKQEIDKTDKEIDQKVYKLYGLSEEEIKVVEGV